MRPTTTILATALSLVLLDPASIADEGLWAETVDLHGLGDGVYAKLGQLPVAGRQTVILVLAYDLYVFRRRPDGRFDVLVYNSGQWGEKDLLSVRAALDKALAYRPAEVTPTKAALGVFEGKTGSPPTAFSPTLDAPEDCRMFYDYAGKFSSNSLMEGPGRTEVTVYLLD